MVAEEFMIAFATSYRRAGLDDVNALELVMMVVYLGIRTNVLGDVFLMTYHNVLMVLS